MIVYFNGEYVPKESVRISPDDRGFLLSDGIYEVIRAYDGRLFMAGPHLERLASGLSELRITRPEVDFAAVGAELIRRNDLGGKDAAIYYQITRGAAPRKHAFPEPVPPTVYAYAYSFQPPWDLWRNGARVILVPDIRWARCDIKTISLLPNVLANQQAKESGAFEAVLVRNGVVTEGSHTNFCAVIGGQLITHPKTQAILPGVTRDVVLDLCRELGIPAREYPVLESELRRAEELMVLGTTTEVMPVTRVNDWQVGDGRPGPVTKRLQEAFRARAQRA